MREDAAGEEAEEAAAEPSGASPYITAEGLARLRAEYEQLWGQRRPEVVRALAAAAAEGDRSENAEYQYRKKELREIDRRVRYLQRRLPLLRAAGQAPAPERRHQVFFGAWVRIEDADGQPRRYRIVGPDEAEAAQGTISVDSPLARALLGRSEGEEVSVRLPSGEQLLYLAEVRYEG
ncbi:MAG TPA: transcription elongation factor GreB [Nevskiaceae bacterium]|nr:transcription elongation factor GreB [Nevskiaceae bacterium]